jgi:hypothetical protein
MDSAVLDMKHYADFSEDVDGNVALTFLFPGCGMFYVFYEKIFARNEP